MIEVNKEKVLIWNDTITSCGWGGLAKVTKLSGLSQPTVLRAVRTGRATQKTITAIDRAVKAVRKELEAAITV